MSSQRLLHFLRTENPIIDNHRCRGRGGTKSKRATWLSPKMIEVWDDFDYDSLREVYGGDLRRILQRECDFRDCSISQDTPFREISDENSFESVLIAWNQRVVSQALAVAQTGLEHCGAREKLDMVRGGQANFPGGESSYNPDWAGIRRSHQLADSGKFNSRRDEPNNILPGDSKLSKKWSSEKIQPGPLQTRYQDSDAWVRPLSQVFTYCVKAKVRYGYIITDKELVALRIRTYTDYDEETESYENSQLSHGQEIASDVQYSNTLAESTGEGKTEDPGIGAQQSGESGGALAFKVIPWERCQDTDSPGMTINLALWWLHMLAGQSSEIDDGYAALRDDVWNERLASGAFSDTSSEDQEPLQGITHDCASYPTPDSIRVSKKRSRSSEDGEEEEEYTLRRKRRASRRVAAS